MSIFADCFPDPDPDTLLLALSDSCARCGHRAALHSDARACIACELMNINYSGMTKLWERIERLEAQHRLPTALRPEVRRP